MANGNGGFILFGVRDLRKPAEALEGRIAGIPFNPELRKELGEKLKPIQRPVYFDPKPILLPHEPGKCVLVARIPTSDLRPHMDTTTGAFYIRGQGGSAAMMDFTQVRDQMLYTEGRLRKVMLLRMELADIIEANKKVSDARSANEVDPPDPYLSMGIVGVSKQKHRLRLRAISSPALQDTVSLPPAGGINAGERQEVDHVKIAGAAATRGQGRPPARLRHEVGSGVRLQETQNDLAHNATTDRAEP